MARDKDSDALSSADQSKHPSSNHPDIDSHESDHAGQQHQPQRSKHTKHIVGGVGRLHARVPSSKALHKHHGLSSAKLNKRLRSPPREPTTPTLPSSSGHRRSHSDAKLSRESSSSNIKKNSSHSNLKRNRSNADVQKRTKSSDKLKRNSSGLGINNLKKTKSQVHFDLGDDGQDDEWVDASNSASPYLSRRGSIASGHSSHKPNASVDNTTPGNQDSEPSPARVSTPDRETAQHREYLTTRLLPRTSPHGAPPQVSTDMAPPSQQHSPDSIDRESSILSGTPRTLNASSSTSKDELISRFVNGPSTTLTSEGSFYQSTRASSRRSDTGPRRPRSLASLAHNALNNDSSMTDEADESALAPRSARRSAAPSAEKSRTQQKLNLQRASSVIEPGQSVGGGVGVVGASPLVGVGGPGYDGGSSRDPRVSKLLERTGMEYLVVRRYQNPVARSIGRLNQLPGADKNRRIPRNGLTPVNGKRVSDLAMGAQHRRHPSLPEHRDRDGQSRRPVTPRRTHSIRTNGGGSSFEVDEDTTRLQERLSGSSLVGGEDDNDTAALLRNLWEKTLDLSASQD
jgi:hypothetical protein